MELEPQAIISFVLRQPENSAVIAQQLLEGTWDPASTMQASLAADPKDVESVLEFIRINGLTLVSEDAETRTVKASGSLEQLNMLFPHSTVPSALGRKVIAILGMNRNPIARSHPAG